MADRIIDIGVGYDDRITVFHLRIVSVAEENRYSGRFLTIGDHESEERKAEMEYDIFVDTLAAWSSAVPTLRTADGSEEPAFPDQSNPADAVREFFKERTAETERIAPAVLARYRGKLQPNVVFY